LNGITDDISGKIIRLHGYASLGESIKAKGIYEEVKRDPHPNVVVFAEEVARRFGLNDQAPSYDENWQTVA